MAALAPLGFVIEYRFSSTGCVLDVRVPRLRVLLSVMRTIEGADRGLRTASDPVPRNRRIAL
jgi:hypothetical protein